MELITENHDASASSTDGTKIQFNQIIGLTALKVVKLLYCRDGHNIGDAGKHCTVPSLHENYSRSLHSVCVCACVHHFNELARTCTRDQHYFLRDPLKRFVIVFILFSTVEVVAHRTFGVFAARRVTYDIMIGLLNKKWRNKGNFLLLFISHLMLMNRNRWFLSFNQFHCFRLALGNKSPCVIFVIDKSI